jgi:hypothetical protein
VAANLPVISFCSGVHWGRSENLWQRYIGNSRHEPLHPRCNLFDEGARQQQLVRLLEHGIGRPCRKYTGTPVFGQPHDFEATSIDRRRLYNWVLEGSRAENVWVVVPSVFCRIWPCGVRPAFQFARKSAPQTNSKAISRRTTNTARLPSGAQYNLRASKRKLKQRFSVGWPRVCKRFTALGVFIAWLLGRPSRGPSDPGAYLKQILYVFEGDQIGYLSDVWPCPSLADFRQNLPSKSPSRSTVLEYSKGLR